MSDIDRKEDQDTTPHPRRFEILPVTAFLIFAASIILTAVFGQRDSSTVSYRSIDNSSDVSAAEETVTAAPEVPAETTTAVSTALVSTEVSVVTESAKTAETQEAAEVIAPAYPIDINRASFDDLVMVKGIGEATAFAIIGYRDSVGVIHRMEQLKEIDGIGDKTLELLCEYFYVDAADYQPPETQRSEDISEEIPVYEETEPVTEAPPEEPPQMKDVNINTASAEEIAQALLLTEEQGRAIVELREKILYFSAVEELILTEIISAEEIERIRDHVII